jgi:hypothetical protein
MVLQREEDVRSMFDYADAVVVGSVSGRIEGDPETVLFEVERQYHGANSRQFQVRPSTVPETMCPGYTVTEGTRHLLWLRHREPQPERSEWDLRLYGPPDPGDPYGVYTPMGCATSQLASSENGREQIAIMERITTPWSPERGAAWIPWAFTAGVLAAIGLAILLMTRSRRAQRM